MCICLASILYVYSVTSNTFHDLEEQRANHWSFAHEIPIHTLNILKAIFKYLLILSRTDWRRVGEGGGLDRKGAV